MSIKLAGCSTLLVRAVEMDGTEVGMTAWAQMTASLLGMHMCGASLLSAPYSPRHRFAARLVAAAPPLQPQPRCVPTSNLPWRWPRRQHGAEPGLRRSNADQVHGCAPVFPCPCCRQKCAAPHRSPTNHLEGNLKCVNSPPPPPYQCMSACVHVYFRSQHRPPPARFLQWGNRLSRWDHTGSWRLAWVLGCPWSRRLSSRCLTTTSFQI